MSTIMITGSNRGLGLEFTRQYAKNGDHVIASCRSPNEASELSSLAAASGDMIRVIALDVCDMNAVQTLAGKLREETIDVLINNAGIYGENFDDGLDEVDPERWIEAFRVNTVAPLIVARAVLPHVTGSAAKKLVFISSKMGSIADDETGGSYIFRSTKAALNMAVKNLSIETREKAVVAVLLHPGWVRTDMGGPQAPLSASDSVSRMRKVIAGLSLMHSGKFLNNAGEKILW